MAEKVQTDADARAQFWKQLEDTHASMLWVEGSGQHPQPMSHFGDRDSGVIWFITSSETDLMRAAQSGSQARLTFTSSGEDYYASLRGQLDIVEDGSKLDELWSVMVAAWFEDGRDDPTIRLLRFTPVEAAIWANQANNVLVGLKLLRAGMSEGEKAPDVGVHRVVSFDRAA